MEIDEQGRQILRVAAGQAGWTYLAHTVEFETSKFNSIYEKTYTGTNRDISSIKFYDIDDVEVTDPINEGDIVKSVVLIKPPYDYELISGALRQTETPTSDVRVWVVGGIIELGGVYVKEFAGGLNMKFYREGDSMQTDGRAAKYMKKDIPGVPFQGNQLQIIVTHNPGLKHKLKLVIEYYKE